ncbi:MAG: flagellar basal body rod protein FlgC [Marinicaulis sp.]|nr:flagellar basal body rod protein FlgC [Marinicaulis sp.]NNL90292.1 flagellar basal body rod protein FlgC [Marinicaulis sp.]
MNVFSKAMDTAASGLRAQGFRLRVVSENIANTDTPGYRRKTVSFDNTHNRATNTNTVSIGRVSFADAPFEKIYDPAHPMADADGNVEMSNVNLMIEMADGREAHRSYEANLASFKQARQMYSGLLELLKR